MQLESSAFVADFGLIEALTAHAVCITMDKPQVIFRQGDTPQGLYILSQGEVILSMTSPGGNEVMSIHAATGSLLGLPALIGNQPYTLTAVARNGSRLCFIRREEFTILMQANPSLSLRILQVLAAEVSSARRALASR